MGAGRSAGGERGVVVFTSLPRPRQLELVLQGKLHDPWRVGGSDLAVLRAIESSIGIAQVDIVEGVEDLRTKEQVALFIDREPLEGGQIGIDIARADQRITRRVAIRRARRRNREGRGVE